jgi:hypothetical protein
VARDSQPGFRLTPQAVLGLFIIAVGLLLTADNLQLLNADRIVRYWPVAIIVVGAVKMAQSHASSGRLFGGLIVLVGMLLAAEHTLGWEIDAEDWWLPVTLIALGVMVMVRAGPAGPRQNRDFAGGWKTGADAGIESAAGTEAARPLTGSREGTISEVAIWAGKQRRCASPVFRRADLTAIMGGIELDLRGASTATGEATIDLFVMWGGIEIWVPPDWAVSNEIGLLMAGAEDKSTGTQAARHRLIVRGFAIMGGVEIKT